MIDAVAKCAARRMRAVFFLSAVLASGAIAHAAPADTLSAATPAAAHHGISSRGGKATTVKSTAAVKPLWAELTPAQQQALAPLAGEWDKLDPFRKNKWLAIGNKFASMKPEEQQRVHNRMRDWVKLTPEQRRIARESYARTKKLNPDQKSARWQQYQQLPEEQKKKLAAEAASRKHVATVLPPTSQAKHHKTLPPIKAAPKPVLERSVTPQAATQSALQSSPQPTQK